MESAPPLTVRNTLLEGLAFPKVIVNPMRRAIRPGRFGNGRAIMVLPGLLTGDLSTSFLRRSLDAAGFRAYGWDQGVNTGASAAKLEALERRLAELHREHGRKVILIGWSLGGVYARVLAKRMPQHTELVMTVASPFSGDRRANRAWRLYEWINDHTVDATPFEEDLAGRPEVPTIAVWSGVDGVVAPACALGQPDEADVRIRLDAQHFALGSSRPCIVRVIEILEERLEAHTFTPGSARSQFSRK